MIKIEYDDADVQLAFKRLAKVADNFSPVLKAIGEHIAETTTQRFETGTGPDGNKWAENKPSTLARKKGDRPLIGDSRSLSTTIHAQVVGDSVEIGSGLEYAAVQQFGAEKHSFAGGKSPWGDIPARPFLGISDEDEFEVLNIIQDHIDQAMRP